MGPLLGIAAVALVASTGLFTALGLGIRSRAELALAAYIVAFTEIVGLALFVSAFNEFRRGTMFAAFALLVVAAAAIWVLRARLACRRVVPSPARPPSCWSSPHSSRWRSHTSSR